MTLLDAQQRLLTSQSAEIVIDWSEALKTEAADISPLVHWLKNYPNRRNVHVYLGKGRHRPAGRRLQNALQAMGCIVTNKCLVAV